MNTVHYFTLALTALAAGCASGPNVLSSKIAATLKEAEAVAEVGEIRASTYWSSSYGHGLTVEASITRSPNEYARNLEIELGGAAEICAALSTSEEAVHWQFLEVRFLVHYGTMPPDSRKVDGVAIVIIRRETLIMLRDRKAPASEYPQHWNHVTGYKGQPDSRELLRW